MKNNILFSLLFAAFSAFTLASCDGAGLQSKSESQTPALVGDSAINKALRFYAGVSREGVQMSAEDSKAWDVYSDSINYLIKLTANNRAMVDSIATHDFADFRDSVDYVFYPFSGADFVYATTIYPNADTYFLCGLEKTGQPISSTIDTQFEHFDAYRQALTYFFSASYFITRRMQTEFHNDELDGICPIITMLMATMDREIISIKHKAIDAEGRIVDADEKSDLIEIRFFKSGSSHEQTLYFKSGNVQDSAFDPNLQKYLAATLPQHRVGSYLKAASYLLHYESFSTMRNFILQHAQALVEDDSGIPYHYLADDFDITLYGKYIEPLAVFGMSVYQTDLQEAYDKDSTAVHPLPFRIGYNNPSNWLCARRKKK